MKHWYQRPHEQLSEYVRTVLILEGFSQPEADSLPIVTNGMSALFCKTEKDGLGNENILQLTISGRSIPEEYLTINSNTTIILYVFKPFALATFFNIPANNLNDQPIYLSDWNAHRTNALKTQLVYAASTTQKLEVLDNLLIHLLKENKEQCEIVQFATDQIMLNPGTEILSDMLEKLNINERTFQRMFKKYVGVTANQYRRICQFHISFSQLRAKDFDKLSDVAYDNGFADQSHFIRSFKEFTQLTPNDYLKWGLKEKNE